MKLHDNPEEFEELANLTSQWRGIPIEAVKQDYIIVYLLKELSQSSFSQQLVFKGGTSLSKCYPKTIERFSEDVDLTFLDNELSEKQKNKKLKQIEEKLWQGFEYSKIDSERSKVAKSSYIWMESIGQEYSIKLEIGSSIRPEPYKEMPLKTYIQEFLESTEKYDVIREYELAEVSVQVLDITRTFLDKVLAVKRHTINNDLQRKVRHIYDVVKLFTNDSVKEFLKNKNELEELLELTKKSDSHYIMKRKNHTEHYDPNESFNFTNWKDEFTSEDIRKAYESLHNELLYTNEKQSFDIAVDTFEKIDSILKEVE